MSSLFVVVFVVIDDRTVLQKTLRMRVVNLFLIVIRINCYVCLGESISISLYVCWKSLVELSKLVGEGCEDVYVCREVFSEGIVRCGR